jgi:hypothetical protein
MVINHAKLTESMRLFIEALEHTFGGVWLGVRNLCEQTSVSRLKTQSQISKLRVRPWCAWIETNRYTWVKAMHTYAEMTPIMYTREARVYDVVHVSKCIPL